MLIRKHSLRLRGMDPPVIMLGLKSAGGSVAERFDGGVAGGVSSLVADELGDLDGRI